MDLKRNGYQRQPNRGSFTLFQCLRDNIECLAGRMYGVKNVGHIKYGKHNHTSYILIYLLREPDGAEGHASDEFMALNSRFYEVFKDGQAGEAEVISDIMEPRLVKRDGLAGLSLVDLFEVQVNHPISGRLLVGPMEKQRRFMGL